jgi:molybdopterin converting factor small subunit
MSVTVEFYGTARTRAGCTLAEVGAGTLGAALCELVARFPGLADKMIEEDRLRSSFIANINGAAFVRDPATLLEEGDHLLILTADVGG